MKYEVKKDAWIVLIMVSSLLIVGYVFFLVPQEEQTTVIISFVLLSLVTLPFILIGGYELQDQELFIRIGFITKRIKYEDIKSVKEARGGTGGYALSMDRVRIKVHNKGPAFGSFDISPKDKEEFIYNLKMKCPNIEEKEY